jgi:uncharacterized membrane protein (DUF2068 family)
MSLYTKSVTDARTAVSDPPATSLSRPRRDYDAIVLRVIAIFKLIKAALLLCAAAATRQLLKGQVAETLQRWNDLLRVSPNGGGAHLLQTAIAWISGLSHKTLELFAVATLIYAALFTVEGVGLLMRKRWAEYITVILTTALIPIELYEIYVHANWTKLIIILINVLIVIYLIWHLRHSGHKRRAAELARLAQSPPITA